MLFLFGANSRILREAFEDTPNAKLVRAGQRSEINGQRSAMR
jgi:hypothetical protein